MSFRGRHSNVLKSIITVLEKIGEDYLLLGGAEVCCGHPLDLVGKVQEADKVREQNNLVFKKVGAKTIITDCPGCLEAIVDHHKVGKDVRILHITEFFDEKITTVPKKLNIRLKYHDPCELFRNSKVTEAPRSLLRKMGIELVEMEPSCCGGGGMLRVSKDSVASEIMQQRMTKEKLQEEPTEVVTCCPSCLEQYELNGIITKDIAEWLVKALDDSKEEEE